LRLLGTGNPGSDGETASVTPPTGCFTEDEGTVPRKSIFINSQDRTYIFWFRQASKHKFGNRTFGCRFIFVAFNRVKRDFTDNVQILLHIPVFNPAKIFAEMRKRACLKNCVNGHKVVVIPEEKSWSWHEKGKKRRKILDL
jgi:hypothetical protein